MSHFSPFYFLAFVFYKDELNCMEIQLGIFLRQSDLLNGANISSGV